MNVNVWCSYHKPAFSWLPLKYIHWTGTVLSSFFCTFLSTLIPHHPFNPTPAVFHASRGQICLFEWCQAVIPDSSADFLKHWASYLPDTLYVKPCSCKTSKGWCWENKYGSGCLSIKIAVMGKFKHQAVCLFCWGLAMNCPDFIQILWSFVGNHREDFVIHLGL